MTELHDNGIFGERFFTFGIVNDAFVLSHCEI
jgi:hypothetical protein